jgi:D-xylose transport system ATP-binding protein
MNVNGSSGSQGPKNEPDSNRSTSMPMSEQPVLECRGIGKDFGGIAALRGVDFDLRRGEIHALCGENGAGKSTLIKILSGVFPRGQYAGQLLIDGVRTTLASVADARSNGIAVIYQELALVDEMTVAENIFLGKEPRRHGLIHWAAVFEGARRVLDQFGLDLDAASRVSVLGVGQRQLVEIAKALASNSRILILDEPTAALSETEVRSLMKILRELRDRGVSCLYVSHRLEEVFSLADRITVLRDGRHISTVSRREASLPAVIRDMVGREIDSLYPRRAPRRGEPLLVVRGLEASPPRGGHLHLSDISFDVHAGEVVGVGGLMGAGRTELLMHLFGAWGRRVRGSVRLNGASLDPPISPRRAIAAGLALVSEDRKRFGLIPEQSIEFNLSLSSLGQVERRGLIDATRAFQRTREIFGDLSIRGGGLEQSVDRLSGGNQQKVVLGKMLLTGPRVLLLDEPTRGIDIGAKAEVYTLMNRLTAAGAGIVLVSSELPELIAMSDRIIMLHDGKIGGAFERGAMAETLLAAATGQYSGAGNFAAEKPEEA